MRRSRLVNRGLHAGTPSRGFKSPAPLGVGSGVSHVTASSHPPSAAGAAAARPSHTPGEEEGGHPHDEAPPTCDVSSGGPVPTSAVRQNALRGGRRGGRGGFRPPSMVEGAAERRLQRLKEEEEKSLKKRGGGSLAAALVAGISTVDAGATAGESGSSSSPSSSDPHKSAEELEQFYTVMYTKRSNKKHKTFEDGVLIAKANRTILNNMEGKSLVNLVSSKPCFNCNEGDELYVGSYEVEVVKRVPAEEYLSGRIFLRHSGPSSCGGSAAAKARPAISSKLAAANSNAGPSSIPRTVKEMKPASEIQIPPGATVLNDESNPFAVQEKWTVGTGAYPVYIDSFLASNLRPHQVDGIRFLYNCIMGMNDFQGKGAILADSMGLGKTVQSLTLMWTLMNRGPQGTPVVKRCMIVVPSTVLLNWAKEVRKWIGSINLKPLVCSGKDIAENIQLYKLTSKQPKCMIISYDLFRTHAKSLHECSCDLMICDEGHKLKNTSIGIFKALSRMETRRKIILTGTPIQNNLGEFYACVHFVNPNLLGDQGTFNKVFADPITRSKDPNASAKEVAIGESRSKELSRLTAQFMIRRNKSIMADLLPPRADLTLMCGLTPVQKDIYNLLVDKRKLGSLLSGRMSFDPFTYMTALRKLINHPSLLGSKVAKLEASGLSNADAIHAILSQYHNQESGGSFEDSISGKVLVTKRLLERIRDETNDRVVIVSTSTRTLDMLQDLIIRLGLEFVRLDGSVAASKRQAATETFNRPQSAVRVFLLSTKAGGIGLNLVGGNRLIMFDPDWNPSNDVQAMARIWRDGQKKNCFVYRLIGAGSLEETILQRQMTKENLSNSMLDAKSSLNSFSKEEMRDLFILGPDDTCKAFDEDDREPMDSQWAKDALLDDDILRERITFLNLSLTQKAAKDVEREEEEWSQGSRSMVHSLQGGGDATGELQGLEEEEEERGEQDVRSHVLEKEEKSPQDMGPGLQDQDEDEGEADWLPSPTPGPLLESLASDPWTRPLKRLSSVEALDDAEKENTSSGGEVPPLKRPHTCESPSPSSLTGNTSPVSDPAKGIIPLVDPLAAPLPPGGEMDATPTCE